MTPGADDPAPVEFELPVSEFAFVSTGPEGIGEHPWDEIPEEEAMEIAGEPGQDPALAFRRTLGMFATGVTVITTTAGEQVHGMTANAFMSVSIRPPLVLISVDRRARMYRLLHEGARFGVNVLADHQAALSDRFAGRATSDAPEPSFEVVHETPLVEGALAHLVAQVARSYWGGDHSLFLGKVEYARYGEGRPLLFHGGRYERLPADAQLLSVLPAELLAAIVTSGSERAYAEGDTILHAGDAGEELFVVLEGAVRVERDGRVVRTFGEGELFGEVAALDGRERTADVIAEGKARCLIVPRDALRAALEQEPAAAWELLRIVAARLRDA